jgi:hypothetical protein
LQQSQFFPLHGLNFRLAHVVTLPYGSRQEAKLPIIFINSATHFLTQAKNDPFPLTLTLSPIGGEGIKKELL